MPNIEDNLATWQRAGGDWWAQGDEWSEDWGGAESEWHTTLLPRIRTFLPAATLVEIAPGFGRWTEFLLPHCDNYIGVDLTPRCVEACRERFADVSKARFTLNDGRSMPQVEDGVADFVFSFDSLVHVEMDVLEAYVGELARVLSEDGVAFVHHSNAGSYTRRLERNRRFVSRAPKLPAAARRGLDYAGLLDRDHWRAQTPTAALFAQLVTSAGLECVGQELVPWGVRRLLLDSMSVVARPGSRWSGPPRVVENWSFMAAAKSAACVARTYPRG